jgi:DNA-directed RNA polymerase subunit RPC12/RpoP
MIRCPKCTHKWDNRYTCLRCKHKWVPKTDKKPKVCPKCKSPYWDRKRIVR